MLAGLRNSKYLTNSITVLNMSALFFIGITGFVLGDRHNYQPFMPFGVQSIFRGSSLLLYSYIGFEMATVAIEEAKNPSKTVPQATVISLLIVTLLYSLAGASLTYLISYQNINIESAFAHAYGLSKWPWARYVISIAIVFSAGGNLLSGTYGSIRIMFVFSNYSNISFDYFLLAMQCLLMDYYQLN
jgi:amino acid transporter